MARLVETTPGGPRTHELGDHLAIGRETGSDLQRDDPRMSRKHAEIRRMPNDRYELVDLGSSRGTWVSGRRITSLVLLDGDEITIGATRLRFEDAERRSMTVEGFSIAPDATNQPILQRLDVPTEPSFRSEREVACSDELRPDYERLRAAFDLTRALASETDLGRMLRRLLETVLRVLQADRGAAFLIDQATGRPFMRMARTRGAATEQWMLSRTVIDEVIAQKAGLLSTDAADDPRVRRSESMNQSGARSVMCVPMIHQGAVLGVLYLDSQASDVSFGANDLELLTTLASQAALVMRNNLLASRINDYASDERKRLERLFHDLPDGLVLLDSTRAVTLWNPRADVLLRGVMTLQKGIPMSAFGPLSLEEVLALEGRGPCEVTLEGVPSRVFQLVVTRSTSPSGEGADTVVVIREVTEEREREARAALKDRLSIVGQLAGGIAHDFNNLLTVITSYTDACIIDAPPRMTEDLGEIQRAAKSAAGLTRQLLTFSRCEAARPIVLAVPEAVAGLRRMLLRAMGEQIALDLQLPADLQPVFMDPGQLEQVLLNFAMNARDAMPSGGCFTIEGENLDIKAAIALGLPATPHIHLTVSDTGCGMPPEVRARVFEPVFSTKSRGRGTGLGLATVFGIVHQAGGAIRVESQVGRGTSFEVFLPVTSQQPPLEVLPGGLDTAGVGAGTTVLVVEDELAVRRVVCRLLREVGYQVLDADSATAALNLAERHQGPIHLVLSDVMMPGLCGPEMMPLLLAKRPEAAALFMSGHTDGTLVGVDGVELLRKPFSRDELLTEVRRVLELSRGVARKQPFSAVTEGFLRISSASLRGHGD